MSTETVHLSIQLENHGDGWEATEPGVDAVGEGESACEAVRAYADEIESRKEQSAQS